MADPSSGPPSPSPAEALFVSWVAGEQAGGRPDFEALCKEHPEHAQALRRLHDAWQRARTSIETGSPP
ncbi:MAG: hypothetical protein ACREIU_00080, partial [Planctomycetota bacterium]